VSDLPRAIRPAIFVGSSQKDLRAFPAAVRSEIGQSLFEAQLGEHPHNAKPLKGFGGVLEIRDNFDGDTYRAVYTIRFEGVLYVLHAFQKKSTKGSRRPNGTWTWFGNACATPKSFTRRQKETDNEHEKGSARPHQGLGQYFR
jgi:phage-related protein